MRKGRNVGYYEMAEDIFYNESSEREYLYDDMMDMVSELLIGTIGNTYSRVDDWIDPEHEFEPEKIQQRQNRGTRYSIKSRIHKFLGIATGLEISIFIDKYILRFDDHYILGMYGYDNIENSALKTIKEKDKRIGLLELFANTSKPEILKIKSVYDLEKICNADDYITLVNVYVHGDDIRGLEKFKQDIYRITSKLCPHKSSNRVVFGEIVKKIPYCIKQISMDMYKEYHNIFKYDDISICEFCDFICKSMKYRWLPLTDQEVTLCRAFSVGTMDLFNNLKPGNIFIRKLDVAIVLDRDATIELLARDILEKNSTRSYDMFWIYDCIHSALDPEYIKCGSKCIEDVYKINSNCLKCYDAMLKLAINSTDFTLALNRYLKSIGRDKMISKLNIHIGDFDKLVSKSYQLTTQRNYHNLLDVMITIDPKYLAELKVEKDIRILITVFFNLVKVCKLDHSLYKNISPENSFNILIGISTLRFIYDSALDQILRKRIETILLDAITISNIRYKEIIIRLMNSLSTNNFSIIYDDIAIIEKYYCINK